MVLTPSRRIVSGLDRRRGPRDKGGRQADIVLGPVTESSTRAGYTAVKDLNLWRSRGRES